MYVCSYRQTKGRDETQNASVSPFGKTCNGELTCSYVQWLIRNIAKLQCETCLVQYGTSVKAALQTLDYTIELWTGNVDSILAELKAGAGAIISVPSGRL